VPPASASLRVQVLLPLGHVHPVPLIDTSVSPAGTVSVTVTVPLVGAAATALLTVTEYVAPICPCVKLPLCVLETLTTGLQELMMRTLSAAFESAINREIGSVLDAAAPLPAVNSGGAGAKL